MKKLRNLIGVAVVALAAFFVIGCETVSAESYVTIDINPSVELIVNRRDIVVMVNPLNEDAETLLVDLELVGLKLEVATELIINKAIELGYIDVDSEETVVSVTAIGYNDDYGLKLGLRIRNHVNELFVKKGIFGYALVSETMEEVRAEAEELGVSPGKLRLVKVVQELYPETTTEEGLAMSVSELMDLIKAQADEVKAIVQALREEFHLARTALIEQYTPLIEALEAEILEIELQIVDTTDEIELADLEALLAAKEDELATLRLDFRFEMDELRVRFIGESAPLMNQVRAQHQQRMQEHHARVEQFRANIEQRRALMSQIRAFQENNLRPRG
jgi:hypothetical protein